MRHPPLSSFVAGDLRAEAMALPEVRRERSKQQNDARRISETTAYIEPRKDMIVPKNTIEMIALA